MTTNYVKTAVAAKQLNVHPQTLRNWSLKGQIETIRSAGGQRLYNVQGYINANIPKLLDPKDQKLKIIYCRVSSPKQRADLERQVEYLQQKYPNHEVYKEVGSGINFKRERLYRVLELCLQGKVSEVVVAHKDRLCRIAFDHFEWLLKKCEVNLIVDSNEEKDQSPSEELAEDLISIIHVFSCKHYGIRRGKRKVTIPEAKAPSIHGEWNSKKTKPKTTNNKL